MPTLIKPSRSSLWPPSFCCGETPTLQRTPKYKDLPKLTKQLTRGVRGLVGRKTTDCLGADHLVRTISGNEPRVALLLSGTRGDHQPAIPFVCALRDRGIIVKVCTKKSFEPIFSKFGVDVVPLPGVDFEAVFTDDAVRNGLASGGGMRANLAINHILENEYEETRCLDVIVEAMKDFRPNLIIWHMSLVVEGFVTTKICNCQGVCLSFFPFTPSTEIPAFPLAAQSVDSPGSWWNWKSHVLLWEYFYLLGKGTMRRHVWDKYEIALSGTDLFNQLGSPARATICAWSPALGPRPEDYHTGVQGPLGFFRLDDSVQSKIFEVPPDLEIFVRHHAREELVYIGWGSMGSGSDVSLTELAVGSLKIAGAKGVIQGGYSDLQLDKLEDDELRDYARENIFFVAKGKSIPHNWLFPQCGVCVHHGGIGTLAACLYAGTPSVVTPVFVDQFYWAHRTGQSDTGVSGPPLAYATRATLSTCIATCLDDLKSGGTMARNAKNLGDAMKAEKGCDRAADFVEKMIVKEWEPGVDPESDCYVC